LFFSILKKSILVSPILFFCFVESNAERVDRIDFYDASDNHLLFINFEYDAAGANISQSTYTSDSTFIKRTVMQNGADGKKEKAVSFNFNQDTSFVTQFSYSSGKTEMTVKDQFGIDQLGGTVNYKQAGDNGFDFFQGSAFLNRISYEKDSEGKTKIKILNTTGDLQYYATLKTSGPVHTQIKSFISQIPTLRTKSCNLYEINFTVQKPTIAHCELISLSGRHIATLFNKVYTTGGAKEIVQLGGKTSHIANGIYLMSLTVDGQRVLKEKILIQSNRGGL
jgi:hypothetical protein